MHLRRRLARAFALAAGAAAAKATADVLLAPRAFVTPPRGVLQGLGSIFVGAQTAATAAQAAAAATLSDPQQRPGIVSDALLADAEYQPSFYASAEDEGSPLAFVFGGFALVIGLLAIGGGLYAAFNSFLNGRGPLEAVKLEDEAAALRNLRQSGVCLVPGVLSKKQQEECLELMSSNISRAVEETTGRLHVSFLRSVEQKATLETLAAPLQPLIRAFFEGARPYQLSQAQLLQSRPGSVNQAWHCDNTSQGLSILIPLVPTTKYNGPTQLLPETHRCFSTRGEFLLGNAISYSLGPPPNPVYGETVAGGALVYDSRVVHRGLGNPSASARPVLILRYDYCDALPPGLPRVDVRKRKML